MRLTSPCPKCGKSLDIQSDFIIGKFRHIVRKCGHLEIKEVSERRSKSTPTPNPLNIPLDEEIKEEVFDTVDESFFNVDGSKCAYDFQRSGIEFLENTGIKALIADATGLGKTIQALLTVKRNRQETVPFLVLASSSITFQWAKEYADWVDQTPFKVMPVLARENLLPGFDGYIMSRDLLARKGVLDLVRKLGIKCVIVDECHRFKNPSSQRTKALVKLLGGIEEVKVEKGKLGSDTLYFKTIFLSATPIKNRAGEYFTVLNFLAPEYFPSEERFRRQWLGVDEKGKMNRIHPYYLEKFKELTSKWILRREKHDVLKDLPKLDRQFVIFEVEDQIIKDAYNRAIDEFEENHDTSIMGTLAFLTHMRRICGIAKIPLALEYAQEFLDSTEESLLIGFHHHVVRDNLRNIFRGAGYNPLSISGEDNAYSKSRAQDAFNEGRSRIMLLSSLAGGEGLNLQKNCSTGYILERQWTSTDEEQVEGRLHRDGQEKPVSFIYPILKGTVDAFFHNMTVEKRKIVHETVGGNEYDLTTDEQSLRDLAEQVKRNRL